MQSKIQYGSVFRTCSETNPKKNRNAKTNQNKPKKDYFFLIKLYLNKKTVSETEKKLKTI
jgi:hypothetical protein